MIWRAGAGGGARTGFSQCTGRCLWTTPLALVEDARKARYALSPEGLRCAMRAVADTSRILAPDGGKVEGFQFQVNGAPVCEAALLIFHDYKRTAFRQALNASRERNALPESGSGVDQKEVATHRHSAAVAWLKEWAESGFVDFMPDDAKVHLPCWLRWDDVHAEYTVDLEAQGETPLKRPQFHRIRTTEFPQLVIPKKVTCVMCTQTRSRIRCYLHQWARVSLGWLFLCPFDDFNACSTSVQGSSNGRPSAANTAALTGRRALIPIRASSYKCLSSAAAILAPAVAAAAAAPAAGRRQWSTGNPANAAGRGRNQHQNKKPWGLAVLICPEKLRAGAVAWSVVPALRAAAVAGCPCALPLERSPLIQAAALVGRQGLTSYIRTCSCECLRSAVAIPAPAVAAAAAAAAVGRRQ